MIITVYRKMLTFFGQPSSCDVYDIFFLLLFAHHVVFATAIKRYTLANSLHLLVKVDQCVPVAVFGLFVMLVAVINRIVSLEFYTS